MTPIDRPMFRNRTLAVLFTVGVVGCTADAPVSVFDVHVQYAKGGGPSVNLAVPSESNPDVTLDVQILGSGFDEGSVATWEISGSAVPEVQTNQTTYVSRSELVANITIDAAAVETLYDIRVRTGRGKNGIGTELFRVERKPADPDPPVTTTELGTLPGAAGASPADMSANGLYVVGSSGGEASIVTPGSPMIELPTPFSFTRRAEAVGVNDLGAAVGHRVIDGDGGPVRHMGMYWGAGAQSGIELGSPSDRYGEAAAVNDAGMIVGRVVRDWDGDGEFENHAMLWTVDAQGGVTAVDLHPVWPGTEIPDQSTALDINDRGQILFADNDVIGELFILDCGMPFDLAACTTTPVEPGLSGSSGGEPSYGATAINNADPVQVLGAISSNGTSVATVTTIGVGRVELPMPEGYDRVNPGAINDEGLVVGTVSSSGNANVPDRALVWRILPDGTATITPLGDDLFPAGLANSGAGEVARIVGEYRDRYRGQTRSNAVMWEVTPR